MSKVDLDIKELVEVYFQKAYGQDTIEEVADWIYDLAQAAYDDGFTMGFEDGQSTGYDEGYEDGMKFAPEDEA